MGWDAADAEGIAQDVYSRAKADPAAPPSPRALANRLGIEIITAPRAGQWGDAKLGRLHGAPVIFVVAKLPAERHRFAIAHELAEHLIGDRRDEDIEGLANAAAAAILVPPAVLSRKLRGLGYDLPALAKALMVTESCAILRVGEVIRRSLVLVSPQLVRPRGDAFEWGSENDVRRLAKAFELPVEIERIRLVDDARRVVLMAA